MRDNSDICDIFLSIIIGIHKKNSTFALVHVSVNPLIAV